VEKICGKLPEYMVESDLIRFKSYILDALQEAKWKNGTLVPSFV